MPESRTKQTVRRPRVASARGKTAAPSAGPAAEPAGAGRPDRGIELAIIGSVQDALASRLGMQAIYDTGGRQDPRGLRGRYDVHRLPRRRAPHPRRTVLHRPGRAPGHPGGMETRPALRQGPDRDHHRVRQAAAAPDGRGAGGARRRPHCVTRRDAGPEPDLPRRAALPGRPGLRCAERAELSGACVRRERRAPPERARGQHERRAGERAPVRRDAAPAEGDRAPLVGAGGHQQHPAGHGHGAELPGHRRPGRRQAARDVRHRRHDDRLARRETEVVHALYAYEHGLRLALPRAPVQARSDRSIEALQTGRPVVLGDRAAMDAMRPEDRRRHRRQPLVRLRAGDGRRPPDRRRSGSRASSASTPSAKPRCTCCRRSRRRWASRWRTRACSTRRSAARASRRRCRTSAATCRRRSTWRR